MVKMTITCKGDYKVTKKHQSTIQMHRTCTQHHPKHINKQKMFNKYLDMCKKTETGQEKTRKTSEKQRKTSSRESIKNDHESFILIEQTTQTLVNIHIYFYCKSKLVSNCTNTDCQYQTTHPKMAKMVMTRRGDCKVTNKHQKTTEKNSTCMQYHQ